MNISRLIIYFSRLSIKTRISLGFFLICIFILIQSFTSYHLSDSFYHTFTRYEELSQKSNTIKEIDNQIDNIRLQVQVFITTGYESFEKKISGDIHTLKTYISDNAHLFDEDEISRDFVERINSHLINYEKTFNYANEELKQRKLLLKQSQQLYAKISALDGLDNTILITVIRGQSVINQYLVDPDIKVVNRKLDKLSQFIESTDGELRFLLQEYRNSLINLVQSNRGFLFLISVVMAAESSEIKFDSSQLDHHITSSMNPVINNLLFKISDSKRYLLYISVILIGLSMLLAYILSISINRPLGYLRDTFLSLSKNQTVDNISTMQMNDEIGSMSRAADVFRQKNEDTRILLQDIERKKHELEQSNHELEQFAYIASHDLQEPLRTITSFVNLLDQTNSENLNQEGKDSLAFITDASLRMKTLIYELLEYSRIGNTREYVGIDMNRIIEDIKTDFRNRIDETKARIVYKQLPVIYGVRTEIRLLFQNLISNALKFKRDNVNPVVTINCEENPNSFVFTITDNGIGIEKKYFDKIFLLFQRLHNQDNYKGTGIGLSHCKKIINSHGGRIWLESVPQRGTTFYIELDKLDD